MKPLATFEGGPAGGPGPAGRIGIWPFPSYGDGLIVLGLANSLTLSGYRVSVFSDALASLSPLLPFDVCPREAIDAPNGSAPPAFDALFVQRELDGLPSAYARRAILYDYSWTALRAAGGHRHEVAPGVPFAHANCTALTYFRPMAPLAVAWQRFARRVLGLPHAALYPGWRLAPEVVPRRHGRRVVIHPEAGSEAKVWPQERSLELARRLRRDGWDAVLLLDERERARWRKRYQLDVPVTELESFADVVSFMAETGFFIGNDSGPGHLASSLGVPTLTILTTKRLLVGWRPGFTDGAVVRAARWWWPPWSTERVSPTVGRVQAAFEALVRRHPQR